MPDCPKPLHTGKQKHQPGKLTDEILGDLSGKLLGELLGKLGCELPGKAGGGMTGKVVCCLGYDVG